MTDNPFGKVDETGTVFVRIGDDWREVGQYPDGSHEEAMAFFVRKFADLEGQVRLLEQRVRGGANAKDVAKSAARLQEQVEQANAVGDLAALKTRLEKISSASDELAAAQQEEQRAAAEAAEQERTQIVLAAEAIAARDLSNVKWKDVSAEIEALFGQWKEHQANGPRLPKSTGDALWKRFRTARTTVEAARRQFFAQLDTQHRSAKNEKQRLVEQARALASQGADGIPAYRRLLDEWKAAGRAGRKIDDALWADFKAAGDVLFEAKAEVRAVEDAEYAENLTAKRALLEEAKPLLEATDRRSARETLTKIQRRWDEIGRVPRDSIREVEDGLRKIEQHVKSLEDKHWQESDPERKARSAGLAGQLEDAIESLEKDLAAAKDAGDAARVSSLEAELATKRQWLEIALAAG